jgi:glycosyltransferase involved in cell wall biosynthesis
MHKKFLIISQVFPPDPAAVGQYFDEAAQALRAEGAEVTILTANRGYDDPDERFEPFENRSGVAVRRLPASSFEKASMPVRLFGQLSFLVQCLARGLFMRGLTDLLVSTSPPMCGIVAVLVGWLRPSVKVHYWVMDLNPDQAVALGVFKRGHVLVKAMNWLNRRILKRANSVIALDRFMAARLRAKLEAPSTEDEEGKSPDSSPSAMSHSSSGDKIVVLPPWPMGQHTEMIAHQENHFRQAQGWEGKFVVMFSGNHSWVHPLGTILDAAERLADDPRFVFVFIGGGKGKAEVDERVQQWEGGKVGRCESGRRSAGDGVAKVETSVPSRIPSHASNAGSSSNLQDFSFQLSAFQNVVSLPYQPLEMIRYSLSAADLHLVSLGDNMSGIVHPCKVYGALAMGRPVLALGPEESYLRDILAEDSVGWSVAHGDVAGAVEALQAAVNLSPEARAQIGTQARSVIERKYNRAHMIQEFVSTITAAR